jgi:putative flippase GtrA
MLHTAHQPPVLSASQRRMRGPLGRVFTRYTLGSIAAMAASELTLLLVYGLHVGGTQVAASAGWAAGAVVNYFLNRNWTWGKRGRAHPLKELLPYWLTAVAGLLLSMWATGAAGDLAPRLSHDHTVVTLIVGTAYLVTYGFLFIAKFILFHYVIFADRRPATDGVTAGGDERVPVAGTGTEAATVDDVDPDPRPVA